MFDDIPEASRQPVQESSRSSISSVKARRPNLALIGLVIGGGILGVAAFVFLLQPKAQAPTQSAATAPSVANVTASPTASTDDTLLGHFPYTEAPASELVPITADGQIKLRRVAADAYRKMAAAAAAEGVQLFPISGFRSISDQNYLFFRVKEARNQGVAKRAEVSAPPGHSEHHTGYAVDIGDATQPETNVSQSFENTAAFHWLSNHAAQYSFEMSFPRGNTQGVSYEPWHWRYVGDQNSLETFYRAQHLKPGS